MEGLGEAAEPRIAFELRYRGQAFELSVPGHPRADPAELRERFEAAHEQRYGYRDPEGAVELVDIRLAMVEPGPEPRPVAAGSEAGLERSARSARFGGEWIEAQVLRGEPPAGTAAQGPAIFELPETTLVLPPRWSAGVDRAGTIVATRG